jgi:tetratricopeptide (TPR) repeat protein
MSILLNNRAWYLCQLQRFEEAEQPSRRSIEILEGQTEGHSDRFLGDGLGRFYHTLGETLAGQGRLAEARDAYARSLILIEPFKDADLEAFAEILVSYLRVLKELGDSKKAQEVEAQLVTVKKRAAERDANTAALGG